MQRGETLVLRAVGDICPGDKDVVGLGVCSATRKRGVSYPFASVAPMLDGADILIGNLEGVLSRRMDALPRADTTFCGESAFAGELRRLGFTGLTVANNHVLEQGEACFAESVELLRGAGLEVFGLRDPSGEFHCRPVVLEVRGSSVGILAYNWVAVDLFPGADRLIAQIHDGAVNYTWHRDATHDRARQARVTECNTGVLGDIRRLRPSVDYLVVLPHWGYEFVSVPPFGCVLEGRSFMDAGADLVVGIHSHSVQGYDRAGRGTVFHGLGNFLFDMRDRNSRRGVVLTYPLGGATHGEFRFDFTMQDTSCQLAPAASADASFVRRAILESANLVASPEAPLLLADDRIYARFERQYRRRKVRAVVRQAALSLRYPFVAVGALRRSWSLVRLIARRLRGERVRW